MTDKNKSTGLVFNIQRHSTDDGPGIRTSVFLKGCPMHCPWCHNPEGIRSKPELVWYERKCIGAKDCIDVCPRSALMLKPEGLLIDRDLCDACGDCEKACPSAALEVLGKERTVTEVAGIAIRDKAFYKRSAGGVTLSGGEPCLQLEFSQNLMGNLKQEGVHLALDTCGGVNWDKLETLVELADLVLYDLKIMDENKHKECTGIPLGLVEENAVKISEYGKPMWIRTPIIPGFTDDEKNIRAIARFIKESLPTVERYDLLAFNNTCEAKYGRLSMDYALQGESLLSEQQMERLVVVARQEGLEFARWSGMTLRKEKP